MRSPILLACLCFACAGSKETPKPIDASVASNPDAGAFPSCGVPGTDHSSFGGRLDAAPGTSVSGTLTLLIVLASHGEAAVAGSWNTSDGSSGGLEGFVDCATGLLKPCAAYPNAGGLCASIMTATGPLPGVGALAGKLDALTGSGTWRLDANVEEIPDAGPVALHGHGTWVAQ